jgi:hypothetical protein
VVGTHVGGEAILQFLDFRSHDVVAVGQDGLDAGVDLGFLEVGVRLRGRLGLAPTAEERVRLQEIREKRLGQTRGKKSRKDSEQTRKGSGA